ncbi:MAG: prepilin-type N-terminal cleavage/methylation domain-containing protein [Solirubrobacteraceae bacterium]
MLTVPPHSPRDAHRRASLSDTRGFTLIELLVAMAAGIVVLIVLFSILDISTTQTARTQDEVAADQLGRTAMTSLLDELDSACIYSSFAPVYAGSNGSKLIFENAYSSQAVPSSATVHEIVWSSSEHTLTDYSYASTGGTWPSFAFSTYEKKSPSSKYLLATNVTEASSGGKAVSIFRYKHYGGEVKESGTTGVSTLAETTAAEISASETAKTEWYKSVGAVLVAFQAAATTANSTLEKAISLESQATFAFSVPNAEKPIKDGPCQ